MARRSRSLNDNTQDSILKHARYLLTSWLELHEQACTLYPHDSNKRAWYKTAEKQCFYSALNSLKYFGLISEFSAMGITTVDGILHPASEVAEFCQKAGL